MIVKLDGWYVLFSKSKPRRRLGKYRTRAEAERRERQIQYFKHKRGRQ